MCLPIDSWFCFCMSSTVNDDYHHPAPAPANKQQHGPAPPPTAPAGRTTQQLPAQRNGGGRYNVNGYSAHQAPTAAAAAAAAEADRKASNDVRRGPVPAGVQEKAANGALKQPAGRNGMVAAAAADGARGVAHNNYYYEREQPTYREDAAAAAAADFYHHNTAATAATADHESPSIC